eukprot:12925275-Prorocentrum_lima.AAC.1
MSCRIPLRIGSILLTLALAMICNTPASRHCTLQPPCTTSLPCHLSASFRLPVTALPLRVPPCTCKRRAQ